MESLTTILRRHCPDMGASHTSCTNLGWLGPQSVLTADDLQMTRNMSPNSSVIDHHGGGKYESQSGGDWQAIEIWIYGRCAQLFSTCEPYSKFIFILRAIYISWFFVHSEGKEEIIWASYEVANLIYRENKSFSNGEFIKKCRYRSKYKRNWPKTNFYIRKNQFVSKHYITRPRVEDIGGDSMTQLQIEAKTFTYFYLAFDELSY